MGFYSNVFLHTSRPVIKCHSLNIIRIWKQCSVFKILEKSEQRKKTCQSKDIKHTLTSSSPRPFITTHVGYVQFIQLPEWRRTRTEPMVAAAEPWMKRRAKKKKTERRLCPEPSVVNLGLLPLEGGSQSSDVKQRNIKIVLLLQSLHNWTVTLCMEIQAKGLYFWAFWLDFFLFHQQLSSSVTSFNVYWVTVSGALFFS